MHFNTASQLAATTSQDSVSVAERSYRIHADELTEGDIVKHFTGDTWLVVSEPQYTNAGITFDVMWLDVDSPDNIQSVSFSPHWRFELVTHQPLVQSETIAA